MGETTITVRFTDDPSRMTPAQLSDLIAQCRTIAKVGKSAEQFVTAQIKLGVSIPGWALRSTRNTREWVSETAAVEAMAAAGLNDPYERKLLSVAAAEKKVPNPERLAAAWETVPAAPSLQPSKIEF